MHADEDPTLLAFKPFPKDVDRIYALTQISGRQTARIKVPLWAENPEIIYPSKVSMEQCTSQPVALYKASFLKQLAGKKHYTLADITGGFGVDCYFLSIKDSLTIYNEMKPDLCCIAENNFRVLGRQDIQIENGTAEQFLERHAEEHFDFIYIDPSRRNSSLKRLVSIKDCTPDISKLESSLLSIADHVIVKLSPMLDITNLTKCLDNIDRITIIALEGECKELLTVLHDRTKYGLESTSGHNNIILQAVNINKGLIWQTLGSISKEKHLTHAITNAKVILPGTFLYEPHAAIMKAGLFCAIEEQYGISRIAPESHLFWSDKFIPDFPGRSFSIKEIHQASKQKAKALFANIHQANITVRNFPLSVEQIRTRYKITDGGQYTIFATTIYPSNHVYIVSEHI